MALATASSASVYDGVLSTPASLMDRISKEHPITVELGIEYSHPELPSIAGVVVENSSTSTVLSPRTGTVASDYPDTFAQTLKIQFLLDPTVRSAISLKTFLPLDSLARLDSGNTYQPEFALYRTGNQRPRVVLNYGRDFGGPFRFGLGLDVGFSVNAAANVFLQSGAGTVSDQRISAKLKPTLIPQASFGYESWTLTFKGENKADFQLDTQAAARIFSGSAGIDFQYTSSSALFFDPMSLDLDGTAELNSSFGIKYGLSYQWWSRYTAHAAVIRSSVPVNCNGNAGCNSVFTSGLDPSFIAHNLLVPESVLEYRFGSDQLSLGYRFKDSIFSNLPSGNSNYLDPPRHDLDLGYSSRTLAGWEWKIHLGLSRLTSQTVVKLDSSSIGGPGYSVSGWLYGGGVNVAIPFKN
jgi:hypothetical protein